MHRPHLYSLPMQYGIVRRFPVPDSLYNLLLEFLQFLLRVTGSCQAGYNNISFFLIGCRLYRILFWSSFSRNFCLCSYGGSLYSFGFFFVVFTTVGSAATFSVLITTGLRVLMLLRTLFHRSVAFGLLSEI